MAKDTYYFSHDYNARNDEKILELRVKYGAEGYGLFWMLVETMAENENGGAKVSLMGGLSLGYGVSKEKLMEFIDHCIIIELFYHEDGFLFSRRMKKHKDFREKLSVKGKEGAEKRWGGYSGGNGGAIAGVMQSKVKESKGKESNEEEKPINGHSYPDLSKSNLFRQPTIPTKTQVWEVFSRQGGTKEMAKTFYENNEGIGWFLKGSPITNFANLVPSFISNWNKFANKNNPVDSTNVKIKLK